VSAALKAAGGGTATGNFQHHGAVDLYAEDPTGAKGAESDETS
jgi:hypothetical protein